MSAIAIGDLVQIVRPTACCGEDKDLGVPFLVGHIYTGPFHCGTCGRNSVGTLLSDSAEHKAGVSLDRVKRIPPPEELERIDQAEEVTA